MKLFNLTVNAQPQETTLLLENKQKERFGIRINSSHSEDVGFEFRNIEDREKFMHLMSMTDSVKIRDGAGVRYDKQKPPSFSLYARDVDEIIIQCDTCDTEFSNGECKKRKYEKKYSYADSGFHEVDEWVCDNCFEYSKQEVAEIKLKNLKEKEELGVT